MSKVAFPKTDRLREMREARHSGKAVPVLVDQSDGKEWPHAEFMQALDKAGKTQNIAESISSQIAAAFIGAKGGKSKSPAKIKAAKQNGMKGGKPKRLG